MPRKYVRSGRFKKSTLPKRKYVRSSNHSRLKKSRNETNARANARAGKSSKRKWINESNENNTTRNKLNKKMNLFFKTKWYSIYTTNTTQRMSINILLLIG